MMKMKNFYLITQMDSLVVFLKLKMMEETFFFKFFFANINDNSNNNINK
jgi:hypothetical protein